MEIKSINTWIKNLFSWKIVNALQRWTNCGKVFPLQPFLHFCIKVESKWPRLDALKHPKKIKRKSQTQSSLSTRYFPFFFFTTRNHLSVTLYSPLKQRDSPLFLAFVSFLFCLQFLSLWAEKLPTFCPLCSSLSSQKKGQPISFFHVAIYSQSGGNMGANGLAAWAWDLACEWVI